MVATFFAVVVTVGGGGGDGGGDGGGGGGGNSGSGSGESGEVEAIVEVWSWKREVGWGSHRNLTVPPASPKKGSDEGKKTRGLKGYFEPRPLL